MKTAAVIVAAGTSRRMGFDKLWADLDGRPVLAHSLLTFDALEEVEQLIVVAGEDKAAKIQTLCPRAQVVPGGEQRHLSVWNGLEAIAQGCDVVAVHDGARPLVRPEVIRQTLETAAKRGAASCARRITETMKRAEESGKVCGSVSRENLWAMETPQCFQLELLRRAYRQIMAERQLVTDEVSAVEALGEPVYLVEDPFPNLKVTFPADLELAARLLP